MVSGDASITRGHLVKCPPETRATHWRGAQGTGPTGGATHWRGALGTGPTGGATHWRGTQGTDPHWGATHWRGTQGTDPHWRTTKKNNQQRAAQRRERERVSKGQAIQGVATATERKATQERGTHPVEGREAEPAFQRRSQQLRSVCLHFCPVTSYGSEAAGTCCSSGGGPGRAHLTPSATDMPLQMNFYTFFLTRSTKKRYFMCFESLDTALRIS